MKKLLAGILTAALVFPMGTMPVFAAGPHCSSNYVDANGDGICDYCSSSCEFVDADGDGVCDNCLLLAACANGHTDADGNGVCDNCGSGCGTHHRNGGRHGHGGAHGGHHRR